MFEKKSNNFKTPVLADLQEVIIDDRTKIYIAVGADPEEARLRYKTRLDAKNKPPFSTKKPVVAPAKAS